MFKVTLGGWDAGKKINDIKALRTMFGPTGEMPSITVSKAVVEAIYGKGEATIVVSQSQVAHMATVLYAPQGSDLEYSWWVSSVVPFEKTDYFDLTQ